MQSLGLRVKTGIAIAVIVDRSGGDVRAVDRRLISLAGPGEAARFVHHAALDLPEREGAAATRRLVGAARKVAAREMRTLLDALRGIERAGVVVGSVVDPARIAGAHMRAHALEGRFYRELVVEALETAGVRAAILLERRAYEHVADALGVVATELPGRIASLGVQIKPWRAEEKLAALAAYWQLFAR
jgi:hypothetical protein